MRYQDHLLQQAATYNAGTAAEFGKQKKTHEQRVLLQAAIILADYSGNKRSSKAFQALLAAVPAEDAVVSALRQQLDEAVEKLGEEYASEASESGQIHETSANSIEAAVAECLGKEFTQIVKPTFASFKKLRRTAAHRKLISLIEPLQPDYVQAGDPETFEPDNAACPGGFSYCLLIKPKTPGEKNLFICFPTAQT